MFIILIINNSVCIPLITFYKTFICLGLCEDDACIRSPGVATRLPTHEGDTNEVRRHWRDDRQGRVPHALSVQVKQRVHNCENYMSCV